MHKLNDDSLAKKTGEFVKDHPYILYGLRKNIINFSSLARVIQKEKELENFDAVLVALRRFQKQIALPENGRRILNIIKNSTLEIRTGINVYKLKEIDPKMLQQLRHFHLIHGGFDKIELITEEKLNLEVKRKGLLEVKIKSPTSIESTPGTVNYISSALAERGINIVKTYSCHGDTTFFIFEKKELPKVIDALDSIGIR